MVDWREQPRRVMRVGCERIRVAVRSVSQDLVVVRSGAELGCGGLAQDIASYPAPCTLYLATAGKDMVHLQ